MFFLGDEVLENLFFGLEMSDMKRHKTPEQSLLRPEVPNKTMKEKLKQVDVALSEWFQRYRDSFFKKNMFFHSNILV